jgi:phage-related protein
MAVSIFPADKIPMPRVDVASNIGDTYIVKMSPSTISTESDGGYKQTRPRNTRNKETYTYSWANLTNDEYKIIHDFYKKVGTYDMFTFTDYALGDTHTVRFAGEWSGQYYHPTGWSVTLQFEEV